MQLESAVVSESSKLWLRMAYDFIAELLSNGIEKIVPVYDPLEGYRYKEVESFFKVLPRESKDILDLYVKAGLFEKNFYDKIILCPSCASPCIKTRYLCPYCGSKNITKYRILEHFRCGTLDNEENFKRDDKLICPRCGGELTALGQDYRVVGVWCECRSCGQTFDTPSIEHECTECGFHFTFKDAICEDVFVYVLSEEAKGALRSKVGYLLQLRRMVEQLGFEVHINMKLMGATGVTHSFDLVLIKPIDSEEKIVAIDVIVSSDEIDERYVAAVFTKSYDTRPFKTILIAIPKASDEARKLIEVYGMILIEAKDVSEAEVKLKDVISIFKFE